MVACRTNPGSMFALTACQPIVSGVRDFCIAQIVRSGPNRSRKIYQRTLAFGPVPGATRPSSETFSPGTAVWVVDVSELSRDAQPAVKNKSNEIAQKPNCLTVTRP